MGGLKLIGLTARTNNINEMDPVTAKIGSLVNYYSSQQVAANFNNRANPGITYVAYTNYDSDEHGEYTFFIGEEITSAEKQDLSKFTQLVIPEGCYQRFTTNAGKMPDVVIQSWQEIWKMTNLDFGGKRKYHTDFELYDKRASDPTNTVVDIYIGIINE